MLSQEDEPLTFFYQIIQGDSIMMFFNERNQFVDKPCADYIRYIRVDNNGDFNSYFEDVTNDNSPVGRGRYVNGVKHGYFKTYHPNGKSKVKGYYHQNIPARQWEYFYENGSPERTLRFTGADTLLIRCIDKKGNITVNDGNGEFSGYVAGLSKSPSSSITAKGKIVNGKPHGKWTSVLNNNIYCKEEFSNGKLIRGTFPNALVDKPYTSKSHLNTFLLGSYFELLEDFRAERCADSSRYISSKKYTFDTQKFNSDLRARIDHVIENDFKRRNTQDYAVGDHYLTIQFSVNNQGKPEGFSQLTPWGQQYLNVITTSIKTYAVFPPDQKTMYFHLKLSLPGGYTYRYNFIFSKERINNL